MDLPKRRETRERDLKQPGLILLQSLLDSVSIKLDQLAQFSSSPDLIEGTEMLNVPLQRSMGGQETA